MRVELWLQTEDNDILEHEFSRRKQKEDKKDWKNQYHFL